jgi:hypothetical protein
MREPLRRWAGQVNAMAICCASPEQEFDVFLTVDRKLRDQQNLSAFKIAVIVLVAQNNTVAALRQLMPKVLESLPTAKPGQALVIRSDT